jgi:hypothetical protein
MDYERIRELFERPFPAGGLRSCDFRPRASGVLARFKRLQQQ